MAEEVTTDEGVMMGEGVTTWKGEATAEEEGSGAVRAEVVEVGAAV